MLAKRYIVIVVRIDFNVSIEIGAGCDREFGVVFKVWWH